MFIILSGPSDVHALSLVPGQILHGKLHKKSFLDYFRKTV